MKNLARKKSLTEITHYILILLSGTVLYFLGFHLTGIFIVLFLVILKMFRVKSYLFLSLTISLIVFFSTSVFDAFFEIRKSNLEFYRNIDITIQRIITPNNERGIDVLDRKTYWMTTVIKERNLPDYGLSVELSNDISLKQEIAESAWPVRPSNESKYIFFSDHEIKEYNHCVILDKKMELLIAHCP